MCKYHHLINVVVLGMVMFCVNSVGGVGLLQVEYPQNNIYIATLKDYNYFSFPLCSIKVLLNSVCFQIICCMSYRLSRYIGKSRGQSNTALPSLIQEYLPSGATVLCRLPKHVHL